MLDRIPNDLDVANDPQNGKGGNKIMRFMHVQMN